MLRRNFLQLFASIPLMSLHKRETEPVDLTEDAISEYDVFFGLGEIVFIHLELFSRSKVNFYTKNKDDYFYTYGIRTLHEPGELDIENISRDGINMLYRSVDACYYDCQDAVWCPLDMGCISSTTPLTFSFTPQSQNFVRMGLFGQKVVVNEEMCKFFGGMYPGLDIGPPFK